MLTSLRTDPRPVAAGRVLLGLGLLLTALEGAGLLLRLQEDRLLTPVAAWLPSAEQLPATGWLLVMFAASLAVTTGVLVRTGLLVCATGDVVLMLTDLQLGSNHRILAVLLALAFVAARSDHAWAPGAAARRSRSPDVPWWPQLLALASVSSCYVFAGLSKLNPLFLDGAELSDLRWVTVPAALMTALAVLVVVTEVGVGLGLWLPRARVVAVLVGVALHVSIVLLLDTPFPFVAFALLCWSVYPLALGRPAAPTAPG